MKIKLLDKVVPFLLIFYGYNTYIFIPSFGKLATWLIFLEKVTSKFEINP